MYSIALHELGHAIVAHWFGDPTPKADGRVTLNPIPSISIVGSIIVPILFVFVLPYYIKGFPDGMIFGWAKPVQVVPANLRPRVVGDIAVSMAGIVINLLIALVCSTACVLAGGVTKATQWESFWFVVAFYNVLLAVFNLIPIPPLDGHHVFKYVFPKSWRPYYQRIGFFGIFILVALMLGVPGFGLFLLSMVKAIGVPIYSAGAAIADLIR